MDNTLMTIIGIFLAALLMFIVPLMMILERNDDISQSVIQIAVANFVDEVSNAGTIKTTDYEELNSKLGSTGNTFEITIEVQHLDENPGKKATSTVGENLRYSTYTSEILNYMYPNGGEPKNYPLKEGDNIIVTVRNTSETLAQQLRKFVFKVTGKGNYELYASSSSKIINSESVISYIETEDSMQPPQPPQPPVNPSVPVIPETPEPEEPKKIAKWEQQIVEQNGEEILYGKKIYGKDDSGETLVTLEIGDFVNYDHRNGNTYTSPASGNGISEQTFTTDSDLYWIVMGVDETTETGELLLACYTVAGYLTAGAESEDEVKNIITEINTIASMFKNTYANNARSINSNDIIKLCGIYGIDISKYGKYGKAEEAFCSFSLTDTPPEIWEGGPAKYNIGQFTNCDKDLIRTLFGNGNYCFLPEIAIGEDTIEYGLYATQSPYLAYAWLTKSGWPNGRDGGVKPVIELGTGFRMIEISTNDEYSEWNIVE